MNLTRVHSSSCEQSRKEGKRKKQSREWLILSQKKSCEPCYMHTETLSSTSPSFCPFFIVFLSFDVDAQRQIQQLKAEKDQGKNSSRASHHPVLCSAPSLRYKE